MSQQDILEIEMNIEQAKKMVSTRDALDRLFKNRDFLEIIKDGYLRDNAIRLVHLKASPATQSPERQADILKEIDAIGGLLNYFRAIDIQANSAEAAIASDEDTLEELRREAAE